MSTTPPGTPPGTPPHSPRAPSSPHPPRNTGRNMSSYTRSDSPSANPQPPRRSTRPSISPSSLQSQSQSVRKERLYIPTNRKTNGDALFPTARAYTPKEKQANDDSLHTKIIKFGSLKEPKFSNNNKVSPSALKLIYDILSNVYHPREKKYLDRKSVV